MELKKRLSDSTVCALVPLSSHACHTDAHRPKLNNGHGLSTARLDGCTIISEQPNAPIAESA